MIQQCEILYLIYYSCLFVFKKAKHNLLRLNGYTFFILEYCYINQIQSIYYKKESGHIFEF